MNAPRRTRLRSPSAVWTAVVAAAAALSCDGLGLPGIGGVGADDTAFDAYATQYAHAVCHRTFACCTADDVTHATSAKDEASCAAGIESELRNVEQLSPLFGRFDAAAGQRCLADLQQACSALFDRRSGALQVCQDVIVMDGMLPLGATCTASSDCQSGDCDGTCIDKCATLSCTTDQACIDPFKGCQPRVAEGMECQDAPCAVGLTCNATLGCAIPVPDGQLCAQPQDCVNTCSTATAGGAIGVCRPGFCQGT